jgi:ribonuclease T1
VGTVYLLACKFSTGLLFTASCGTLALDGFRVNPMPSVLFSGHFLPLFAHRMSRLPSFKSVLTHFMLAVALFGAGTAFDAQARSWLPDFGAESKVSSIALADLPPQGRGTYDKILQGGPFPFEKDGSVFGNRERQLPVAKRGYYREYTVKSPGSRNRGARRIVCGGNTEKPDACFYTDDHYATFRKIVP